MWHYESLGSFLLLQMAKQIQIERKWMDKKCVAAMTGKGFHVLRLMLDLFWILWQHEEVIFWVFQVYRHPLRISKGK